MESIPLERRAATLDLVMLIIETTGSLSASIRFNTDLFDAATIARMAEHFHALLESVIRDPAATIGDLEILTDAERQQLLVEFNDTKTDYPKDKCIHQLFEEQVQRTPDNVAVVFEGQQLTYAQLNARANQLAHHLQTLGVGPEVPVAICMERCPEMVVGLLGILKAGGAYVPLDPAYPKERLSFMMEDAHAAVLLTRGHMVESVPETRNPRRVSGLRLGSHRCEERKEPGNWGNSQEPCLHTLHLRLNGTAQGSHGRTSRAVQYHQLDNPHARSVSRRPLSSKDSDHFRCCWTRTFSNPTNGWKTCHCRSRRSS